MAKASERKGIRTEEYECCAAERRRWADRARTSFLSFPVIRNVPCPTCKKVLEIRFYERPGDEAGTT
jgi:hypothetical protein